MKGRWQKNPPECKPTNWVMAWNNDEYGRFPTTVMRRDIENDNRWYSHYWSIPIPPPNSSKRKRK